MSINVLGISAFYHDSAAVILKDGEIIAAAQEERFTRKKHDPSFPVNAVRYCLNYGGFKLDGIDAVCFYDKPLLKFERLLETYSAFAPRGVKSFVSAIPVWMKEKLFLKKLIADELNKISEFDKNKLKLLFPSHHMSHAASAFYPSCFDEAAILTIDGVGEWATATIGIGKGNKIKLLKELKFPHSVGLLYSAFTYYLGFRVNSGEYKLMGLAPYGDPSSSKVKEYKGIICNNLVDVKDDGSIWLNQDYFDYAAGLTMVKEKKWEKLFGFPKRKSETDITQQQCNLALAIQQVTEDIVIRMAKTAKRITNAKYLCMAGGVALNCVANGKLLRENLFDDIWIQPAAGDAGGALGAAFAVHYMYYNNDRKAAGKQDVMQGAFLGPEFSSLDIELTAKSYKAVYKHYENYEELCDTIAGLLSNGKTIGWFQGRMEWGPRALGNRSILGDARDKEIQKRLNVKIKLRESFRPFAPAVINEDTGDYFEMNHISPYMLFIADVKKNRRNALPDNFHSLPIKDKLYFVRSDVPAITHLDYSARVQTVHKGTNPRFWKLINAFKKKTGHSVIVNTSFNVRGEPIVCSPSDAYRCFMKTDIDCLVIGNYLFDKKEQPVVSGKIDFNVEYILD